MLIYNYQKEFLGIDEADLKALGFNNLLELRSESADFADLFVKTPGFIHNFKHVHWIDFIDCAESAEDSKVVIHAKTKNYRCTIKISTVYLVDNPSQKAYAVNLTNLRELSAQENEQIAQDIMLKPTPKASTTKTAIFQNQNLDNLVEESAPGKISPVNAVTPDPYEEENDTSTRIDTYDIPTTVIEHVSHEEESSNDKQHIEEESADDLAIKESKEEDSKATESFTEEDNFKLDLDMEDLDFEEETKEVVQDTGIQEDSDFDNNYVYDPKVASDELGLPVDLIEEFIEDFIAQASEFKDGLYTALNDQDMENVKVLSHKLKGVAANLRVEDAFEVLTTVNVSDNFNEIKKNLDHFYIIIAKLAGEPIQEAPASIPAATSIDDDDFDISFKEEEQDKPDEDKIATETKSDTVVEEKQDEDLMIEMSDLDNDDNDDLYMDNTSATGIEEDIESPDLIDFDLESDEKELELLDMPEENSSEELELLDFDEADEEDNLEKESLATETSQELTYDRDSVANEIGIGKQNFDVLFVDYIDESKELSHIIGSAIEQGDSQTWKKGAMKLKGMSDNMRVHSFSKELDTLIDTNDADVAQETIDKISSNLVQISNT